MTLLRTSAEFRLLQTARLYIGHKPTDRLSQTVWATRSDLLATQLRCCRLQHGISWHTGSCVTSIKYHAMMAYRGMEVRFHATFTSPASRHDRNIPCKQPLVEFEQQAGWTSGPERTPHSDWTPEPDWAPQSDCTLARRENLLSCRESNHDNLDLQLGAQLSLFLSPGQAPVACS